MIIITGASRGIGLELFKQYLWNNHNVLGTYNNNEPKYNKEFYNKIDISNYEDVSKWITELQPRNITLINCAGINYNSYAHNCDIEEWTKVINVNLIGTFNVIRSILPFMREQEYGNIINISSVLADKAVSGTSAYSASKSALKGLTNVISLENISKNIYINNIELGYSKLGMIEQVPNKMKEQLLQDIPINRFCDIDDIYHTVEYLRTSKYITGTAIKLNGGLI